MSKYNLTFWQRLSLIPWYFYWLAADPKEKKSWHLVKKGMEKHECKFTIPDVYKYRGRDWKIMKCEHEGCNIVEPID